MIRNSLVSYGIVSRFLHWLMSVMIIAMIAVGLWMTSLPANDEKWFIYGLHKSTGLLILGLILFRFYWRLSNSVPNLPSGLPSFIEWASKQNVRVLYALMLLMPVSGVAMSLLGGHPISFYGLFTISAFQPAKPQWAGIFDMIHTYASYLLIGIVCFHIIAAFVHHFIFKDNVLRRMACGK